MFKDGSVDQLLVLRGDGMVRVFDGSYSECLQIMEERSRRFTLGLMVTPRMLMGWPYDVLAPGSSQTLP